MVQDDNKKDYKFSVSVPQGLKRLSDLLNHVQEYQIKVPGELISVIGNIQNSVNTSNFSPLFTDRNGIFRQQIEQATRISSVMSTIQTSSPFIDAISRYPILINKCFLKTKSLLISLGR